MKALFREHAPYSLRLFITTSVLTGAILGWIFIVNGPHEVSVLTATLGVLLLLTGFLLLGVLGTQRLPYLPLWISLGFTGLWAVLILRSLPEPLPLSSTLILSVVILLSIAAAFLAVRNPCITLAFLAPMALLGVYGLVVVPAAVWNGGGAEIHGTGAPITVLGAACLAAAWHAWSMRDRVRNTVHVTL